MPTPPLDESLYVEALNLVELHGSAYLAVKAGASQLPAATLKSRAQRGQILGLKPTVKKEAPRIHTRQRLGRMHLVIPDTQVKDGVPLEHMEWIGNYLVEKQPDVIVQIGDFADMPSLSNYDRGKASAEGRRYTKDIRAVHKAMDMLLKPIQDHNRTAKEKYTPEMHLTLGNHEYRIIRECEDNPRYEGHFSYDDLGYEDYGWKVHDFLKVIEVDGVEYAHYFTSGVMGRPVSSAAALLRERQRSCTMGHVQWTDMAIHKKTQNIALMSGTCYLHDEDYLGPQGNSTRRQIIVKHEVESGRYDPMFVSLRFLEKAYS
jgi:Calcineurin-like phosphoesterase